MILETLIYGCVNGINPVVKDFMSMANDQAKKHQVLYKREFQKVTRCFTSLNDASEADDALRDFIKLATSLKATDKVCSDIAKLQNEQLKYDWKPLADKCYIHKGIINHFSDVINIHKLRTNIDFILKFFSRRQTL